MGLNADDLMACFSGGLGMHNYSILNKILTN